ncbi:hypothetical protein [Dictyobacter formicarum]|uniref:Uncharacterized protein n=1 Tax=Dictyobacter formicarum TaxID=2778368 RepID=A0ABQ3VS87_9CHLR|nr:hypothetical protein [Dictyobacter formicarum]GHO88680.1 hypothetical protein KSZ_66860 [Dictyobacter formicarum]
MAYTLDFEKPLADLERLDLRYQKYRAIGPVGTFTATIDNQQ